MALFDLCYRKSYRELMNLANQINPDVKFIDHSEKDQDSDARIAQRRRAASEAFEKTFGRKCLWFMEQREDMKKEEPEFQEGQIDEDSFPMNLKDIKREPGLSEPPPVRTRPLPDPVSIKRPFSPQYEAPLDHNSSMHPEGDETAPAVQLDRLPVRTKRGSSATPTKRARSNLQEEEPQPSTSRGYPSVTKEERDETMNPSTKDFPGRPGEDQLWNPPGLVTSSILFYRLFTIKCDFNKVFVRFI